MFFFMVRLMDLRPVLDCLSVHDRYKKKHKFQFSIKQNKKEKKMNDSIFYIKKNKKQMKTSNRSIIDYL